MFPFFLSLYLYIQTETNIQWAITKHESREDNLPESQHEKWDKKKKVKGLSNADYISENRYSGVLTAALASTISVDHVLLNREVIIKKESQGTKLATVTYSW